MHNIYIIRNNYDAIWIHTGLQGALLFHFSQNSCDSSISDSIPWNYHGNTLHGNFHGNTMENLACNILTLKDDTDIFFESIAC